MTVIYVPVHFSGIASVIVPDELDDATARLLASKLAIAKLLATPDNMDCEEAMESACAEFCREALIGDESEAERLFAESMVDSVAGSWGGVLPRIDKNSGCAEQVADAATKQDLLEEDDDD